MGNVKRENRLLFCALALFFFVFLESTLFFQANLAQPGGHGPFLSQFPIQGASALGLLAFPLNNRLVGEKGRPVFMGTVTVLGVASLVGVVFASSPLVIACMGAVGFFLIGLAGATVYWATCVRSRSIARFATLIGSSHALGVLAQIPLLEFTSNHLVEAVVLSASIIALGVINARIWPPRSALAEFSAQREQRKGKRLESSKFAGWRLDHMTPRTAVIVIFALVLLFSVLFNTLYTFIDIGSPWTSQYTNITPRVLMAVGGFAGGVLFDLHRARYLGIAMFWMMLLSVGAMLGVEAGGPYVVGEVVYFLGSGVFMTFYTAVFVWIAQFLRAPDLWCSMGRALNNVTAIAIGAPALLAINLTSPIAVVVLLIPLIIGINALLFAAGMLDLNPRPRGGETGGRAGKQAGAPPGSAGNITPGQAATSKRTPVASEAAHGIANGDMPVKSSATDHVPEAAEGPAPGAAPSVDDAAIDPEAHLADFAGRFSLTPRETEVLAAVTADERPLKHVAADMGISLRVLQRHLTSLYQKTGTQSRVGLTKLFWE
ncbi:helix-turn-helix transcriptional regulator [Senegalimassilia anaerobia]|uniref:helix-turn-helix transcriptional regulator n=1 Tax=Senegalimassilia anaerobia TaxID=1473216 RepID=UPI00026D2B7A|nr:helix-turn-helix transcriptional regulator [Senegalimassilia anaerobia]